MDIHLHQPLRTAAEWPLWLASFQQRIEDIGLDKYFKVTPDGGLSSQDIPRAPALPVFRGHENSQQRGAMKRRYFAVLDCYHDFHKRLAALEIAARESLHKAPAAANVDQDQSLEDLVSELGRELDPENDRRGG